MATAVASRFAVLSVDDDDDYPKKNQKKKVENKKPGVGPGTSNQKSDQKKKNKKSDTGKAGDWRLNLGIREKPQEEHFFDI